MSAGAAPAEPAGREGLSTRRSTARAATARAAAFRVAPRLGASRRRVFEASFAWLWQTHAKGRAKRAALRVVAAALVLALTALGGAGDRALHGLLPQVRERGELVALLRDDVPAEARDALVRALLTRPRVSSVRFVGSHEALSRLEAELGDRAALLDNVEEGFLPSSLEIGVAGGPTLPADVAALAARLRASPLVTDVDVWRGAADPRTERWLGATRVMRAALLAFGVVAVAALTVTLIRSKAVRTTAEARLFWLFGIPRLVVGGWEALSLFAGLFAGLAAASAGLRALAHSPWFGDVATAATLTRSFLLTGAWAVAVALARALLVTRTAR